MRTLILPFLLLIALSFNVTISAMAQVSRGCPCRSLLGVAETSFDMRDLLDLETPDVRVAEAVALFCDQVKKRIDEFAALSGRLDSLVFSGDIGQNAPLIWEQICDDVGFLGIKFEERRSTAKERVISVAAGRLAIRLIRLVAFES